MRCLLQVLASKWTAHKQAAASGSSEHVVSSLESSLSKLAVS